MSFCSKPCRRPAVGSAGPLESCRAGRFIRSNRSPGPTRNAQDTTERWEFDPELARDEIARRFRLASLDGLGIESADVAAVERRGALLRYLTDLQPGGIPHLQRPVVRRADRFMWVDEMTRRNLELVEPLRSGAEGVTLLETIDRTVTPMGARLLRRWVLSPSATRPRSTRGSMRWKPRCGTPGPGRRALGARWRPGSRAPGRPRRRGTCDPAGPGRAPGLVRAASCRCRCARRTSLPRAKRGGRTEGRTVPQARRAIRPPCGPLVGAFRGAHGAATDFARRR